MIKFFNSYIKILSKSIESEIEMVVNKFLPKKSGLVYLDLGCDNGEKTLNRAAIIGNVNVYGVEVEKERAKDAAKRGFKIYDFDLNGRWSLKNSSIDCITATEVVEHLVDLDNFFSEARRVLKYKGKIIISTENLSSYHNIFALLLGNQPYTGPYLSRIYPIGHRPQAKYYQKEQTMNPHLNVMTAKSLKQLLKVHGFKVNDFTGVGFYPLPQFLAKFFCVIDKYHASYFVILGEK